MNLKEATRVACAVVSDKPIQPQRRSTTHRETYFHLRGPVPTNKRDENNNIVYTPSQLPLNLAKKYNGITVFLREEDNDGTKYWRGTYTACSKQDQFCRAKGRSVSHGKYFQPGTMHMYFDSKPTYEQVIGLLAVAIRG